MLTTLDAYSPWPSAPILPLSGQGAQTDPIQIRNIDGLGPVNSSVNMSPYGSMDGESFTGTSVGARNIVITVGLNPDWDEWTMESLRRLLYLYFMPKQPTRLVFHSSDEFPSVEIRGYVESVEPSIFSKDIEMQISIICPDPYFYAMDPVVLSGSSADDPIEIDYIGSVEAGVNVKVTYSEGLYPNQIGIQIGDPAKTYFRVRSDVTETRYFVVNSIPGSKYARLVYLDTGVIRNFLYRIEEGSKWPTLYPGENSFKLVTDRGVQDWVLAYTPKFGGL